MDTTLRIEFDGSDAEKDCSDALERLVRKATEPLRCPLHFPGRVSFQARGKQVHVVDACCPVFLEKVSEATIVILAQWRAVRAVRYSRN
jgi:hypothetical protein